MDDVVKIILSDKEIRDELQSIFNYMIGDEHFSDSAFVALEHAIDLYNERATASTQSTC